MPEFVILVDEQDQETGISEKLEAHKTGQLHRAISVFIFNSRNEMLLQKRAENKYHSGGLWTNACCSHPRPGEDTGGAAKRRLQEEMGLECNSLQFVFSFTYRASLDNKLIEHELDHVFIGRSDETPRPDPNEVAGYKWLPLEDIRKNLAKSPELYTYWFRLIFERVVAIQRS